MTEPGKRTQWPFYVQVGWLRAFEDSPTSSFSHAGLRFQGRRIHSAARFYRLFMRTRI